MNERAELIIIGAGIAGVSAAIYAKRSGLDALLFESKAVGGQLLFMEDIDNYVGLGLGVKGRDLAFELSKTLKELSIPVINEEIRNINLENGVLKASTADGDYYAKSLIIATGASFRKLGVNGEAEFLGKGVSYCAVCDGFFFKNKEVAVVGGGNSALEEALYLSEIAKKVTLIHRRDKLRALDYLQKQLFEKSNIEVVYNSTINEMKGSQLLKEIVLEDKESKNKSSIKVDGLFVAIGIEPNTTTSKDIVSCDEAGFIIADGNMQTSCNFIWTAGDCRKRPLRQLITAASEGAIAAMSAYKYLKGHYISS